MKPPILDRIRKEDIPQAPKWMDRVLYVLNRFLESVVLIFNKNINFADNIDSQIYEDSVSYSALTSGYKFKATMKSIPKGVILLKIVKNGETYTNFTNPPYLIWEYQITENNEKVIYIRSILNIDNDVDYNITLLVI